MTLTEALFQLEDITDDYINFDNLDPVKKQEMKDRWIELLRQALIDLNPNSFPPIPETPISKVIDSITELSTKVDDIKTTLETP